MSGIGGGLYDHDPWGRDRPPGPAPESRERKLAREWLFWMAMVLGMWVAFQGSFPTAFWFLIMVLATLIVIFFWTQTKIQMREIKKKGLWQ